MIQLWFFQDDCDGFEDDDCDNFDYCDDYDDWDDYGVKGWRYPNPGQQSHDMFRQIVSDMADILSPALR